MSYPYLQLIAAHLGFDRITNSKRSIWRKMIARKHRRFWNFLMSEEVQSAKADLELGDGTVADGGSKRL